MDSENRLDELQFRWDWDDDGNWDTDYSNNHVIVHPYSSTGHYMVKDLNDETGTSSLEVIVLDPIDGVPVPPSSLKAISGSGTQINLTWNDNSDDEDGFRIERNIGGASEWSQVFEASSNSTNIQDDGLSLSTLYYYRVKVYNDIGPSHNSNLANTRTSAELPPSNMEAETVSSSEIDIAWTDNSDDEEGFNTFYTIRGTNFILLGAPYVILY